MSIDFRNINTLWASILVETLVRLGLNTAVISPGSRSTPLTIAFAQHPQIKTIPILDERSASFFALGIARKGTPVALICTSGTAAANFYPAVIEATQSRVSLLILTADRPPELRDCHAGQAIDQSKLYGTYPNWQAEIAVPEASFNLLNYLRQVIIQGWERTLYPIKGVVHLNLPFREPLAPIPQNNLESIKQQFDTEHFFHAISVNTILNSRSNINPNILDSSILDSWKKTQKGIIIAGLAQPQDPEKYCQSIANLSRILGFPVLAEALSPIRNYYHLNPHLISTYDLILRNPELAKYLIPEVVIQIGELPTSKELRNWLEIENPSRWIVDRHPDNFDSLHGKTIHIRTAIEDLVIESDSIEKNVDITNSEYLDKWLTIEEKVKQRIADKMETIEDLFEGKTAWLLPQILPQQTPIFVANSMPVRYLEYFWQPNHSHIIPCFNRGANGIDGTLSTALGIAYRQQSSILLTGDLALLHDTNGFLLGNKLEGHLTIILINNNGGGIFEMLPISEFANIFEDFFATPQNIDFAKLCATYEIEHKLVTNWQQLKLLLNSLPATGIRVLEIATNRHLDALWLRKNLKQFANFSFT
jgi:2-succinyl-5-enolpyruvyl-6-hydroxy-3-cyclohexene-1-carboxylate synthase